MSNGLGQDDIDDLLGPTPPLDSPLPWSWCRSAADSAPTARTLSLRRLAAEIPTHRVRTTGDDEADKQRLPMLSGGRFEGGRRAEHLRGFRAAILDIDNSGGAETVPLETLAARLRAAGINFLVASSPSYERDGKGPRARVMSVLRREASPEAYLRLLDRLHGAILHPMAAWTDDEKARHRAAHPNVAIPPAQVAAAESWTPTQHFFVGTFDDADPAIVLMGDGAYLDEAEGIAPAPRPSMGRARLAETDHEAPDDLTLEVKRGRDEASLREDLASGRLASALRHAAGIGRQEYPDREWQTPILAPTFGCPPDLREEVRDLILAEFVERSNRMARWRADGKAEAVIRQAKAIWRNGLRRDVADPVTLASLYQAAQAAGWSWGETRDSASIALLSSLEGRSQEGEAGESTAGGEGVAYVSPLDLAADAASDQDPLSDRHLSRRFANSAAGQAYRACPSLPKSQGFIWEGSHWADGPGSRATMLRALGGFLAAVGREYVAEAQHRAEAHIAEAKGSREIDLSADVEIAAPGEGMASAEQRKRVEQAEAEAAKMLSEAKKAAAALQSAAKRKSVCEYYETLSGIIVGMEELDLHRHLIATPSGTIDLRDLAVRPADPADLITASTTAVPDFGGEPAEWLAFLREIFPEDTDATIDFLRRWLGYCVTGETREQKFLIAQGEGRNGKGVILRTVEKLIGKGYAKSIPVENLLSADNDKHKAPLARLRGARLILSNEPPEGKTWNDGLIKLMTGRDPVPVNHMHGETFDLVLDGKLVFQVNPMPRLATTSAAMRARVLVLPFPIRFWEANDKARPEGAALMDTGLEERLLTEEGPKILGWILTGARDWYASGLRVPRHMLDAAKAYVDDQEPLLDFVTDVLIIDKAARTPYAEIYPVYRAWCEAQGIERPLTVKTLGKMLADRHGLRRFVGNGVRGLTGASIRRRADPFDEPPPGIPEDILELL